MAEQPVQRVEHASGRRLVIHCEQLDARGSGTRQPFGQLHCCLHRDVAASLRILRLLQPSVKRWRRGESGELRDALKPANGGGGSEPGHHRQRCSGAVGELTKALIVSHLEEVLRDREVCPGLLFAGERRRIFGEIAALGVPCRKSRDHDLHLATGGLCTLTHPGDQVSGMGQHQPGAVGAGIAAQRENAGDAGLEQFVYGLVELAEALGLAGEVRIHGHPGLGDPGDQLTRAVLTPARSTIGDRHEIGVEFEQLAHRHNVGAQLLKTARRKDLERTGRSAGGRMSRQVMVHQRSSLVKRLGPRPSCTLCDVPPSARSAAQ